MGILTRARDFFGALLWFIKLTVTNLAISASLLKPQTSYWAYFKTVNRHRKYVYEEARKLGIPLLGFIHDWSKYLPSEFIPYARYFNGGYARGEQPDDVKLAFDFAWLHHQRWNKHHWQSYVLHNDQAECVRWEVKSVLWDARGNRESLIKIGDNLIQILAPFDNFDMIFGMAREMSRLPKALPMPHKYRREMLADWRVAGRAYGNTDTRGWYMKNKNNIILHPDTRKWVERQLGITETYKDGKLYLGEL